ncbi:MAG TPA: HupE/UreJ family protein [Myxococcota bacterium]|nr:HupE/UreJ family protein [Myxococcota bacterium]
MDVADLELTARRRRRRAAVKARVLLAALALSAGAAGAHPLAPSLLELEEQAGGHVLARFAVPRASFGTATVTPHLPERCAPLGAPSVRAEETRFVTEQSLDCGAAGLAGAAIGTSGLDTTHTDLLLRIALASGATHQVLLNAERPTFTVPERAQPGRVLVEYGWLGAEHLATGFDHLLFLAGLALLVRGARRLIATLTAFTVGHSITLALVALGVASPPTALVEIGIAASLVLLAIELALGDDRTPSLLRRRPGLASGAFGLVHGMGFAGALREIGLPADAVPLALFAFNLGLELTQIAFVGVPILLWRAFARLRGRAGLRPLPVPRAFPTLTPYAIGGFGAFLVIERVAGLFAP